MHMHKIKWFLRTGITTALLAIFGSAHADAMASIRASGIGGAAVAYGQDSLTAFYNPANITDVCDRVDLGLSTRYNHRSLNLANRAGGAQAGTFQTIRNWDFYGQGGAVVHTGGCNEWAFGASWSPYSNIHNHYRTQLADFSGGVGVGSPMKFNHRTEVLTITSAYNICEGHAFGVAANCYFSWLDPTGFEGIDNATYSAFPGHVTNKTTDYSHGVGITLGWQGKFDDDRLAVGFAWSPHVAMSEFRKYRGLIAQGRLDIPETFRLGTSYHFSPCTVWAVDGEFRRYSKTRGWSNPFPGSSGGAFEPLFGSTFGPGFDWQDQWIIRTGVEWRVLPNLVSRLGYRYEKSPIRRHATTASALNPLTLNVVENYITAGFTWEPSDNTECSMFGEYGVINRRKSYFPAIGTGGTWNAGDQQYKAYTASLGLSYGWTY